MTNFFKEQRDKLKPKEKSIIKLSLWAASIVWMVMYIAFGIIGAWVGSAKLKEVDGLFLSGQTLSVIFPIWLIFTILLTALLMARWINRKLK